MQAPAQSLRNLLLNNLQRLSQPYTRNLSSKTPITKLSAPAPGTVSLYEQHLFIEEEGHTAADWPASVERTPAVFQAFSAIARHKPSIPGTVKVTAYASQTEGSHDAIPGSACNVLLFPAGLLFESIQPSSLDEVVANHVVAIPSAPQPHHVRPQELSGLHLFVCCHAARDVRCGNLGPQLARRLQTLVRERGLSKHVHVYQCSHVGGHKYAANVLCYGAISPNDGDWFGGLSADTAAEFLTALTEIEFGSEGGFDHPKLRPWWRGRMGLTKDEQKASFQQQCLCLDISEDDEPELAETTNLK